MKGKRGGGRGGGEEGRKIHVRGRREEIKNNNLTGRNLERALFNR